MLGQTSLPLGFGRARLASYHNQAPAMSRGRRGLLEKMIRLQLAWILSEQHHHSRSLI